MGKIKCLPFLSADLNGNWSGEWHEHRFSKSLCAERHGRYAGFPGRHTGGWCNDWQTDCGLWCGPTDYFGVYEVVRKKIPGMGTRYYRLHRRYTSFLWYR